MVGWRPAISLTSLWIQQLSENSQRVVTAKTNYAMATVKEVLTLSQSAASVIPVPFLKEAINVALKIIQLCEVRWIPPFEACKIIDQIIYQEASDVEQKVKELQVRVGNLMIVIVDHVTLKDEEDSKETVMKIAKGIEQDIKELFRCGLRMQLNASLLRLLMTLQYSWDNQWRFNKNQRSE